MKQEMSKDKRERQLTVQVSKRELLGILDALGVLQDDGRPMLMEGVTLHDKSPLTMSEIDALRTRLREKA